MKITIESTDQITTIDGVTCRYWQGRTDTGIPCKVFVHRIAVHNDLDSSEFESELKEQLAPGRFVSLANIL